MGKYVVFAYSGKPKGGINDAIVSTNDLDEAWNIIIDGDFDGGHVINRDTWKLVILEEWS